MTKSTRKFAKTKTVSPAKKSQKKSPKTTKTRNYKYGAKRPIDSLERVNEQMSLHFKYKNHLVELELERRKQVEDLIRKSFPSIGKLALAAEEAEKDTDKAYDEAKKKNQKKRSRILSDEDRNNLRAIKKHLSEAREAYKNAKQNMVWRRVQATNDVKRARKELEKCDSKDYAKCKLNLDKKEEDYSKIVDQCRWPKNFQQDMDEIEAEHTRRRTAARGDVSEYITEGYWLYERRKTLKAYWGTYQLAEEAMNKAKQGVPPRVKKFESKATGTIAIHIQNRTMTVDDLMSMKDSLVRLEPMPQDVWQQTWKEKRTNAAPAPKWYLLHIRVNGNGDFARIPVSLHRPLPPDAHIKWVKVFRNRVANNHEWSVMFVIGSKFEDDRERGHGKVAIDFSWRKTDKGIRVASWVGNDGDSGELVIPDGPQGIGRWTLPVNLAEIISDKFLGKRTINSEGDKETGGAKGQLIRFLNRNKGSIPEWLLKDCENIAHWNQPHKLINIVRKWADNRFDGDNGILKALQTWRHGKKDGILHLINWKGHGEKTASYWRDSLYRNFVAQLSRKYGTCLMPKLNLSEMQSLPNLEDDEQERFNSRNRRIACIHRLVLFLKEKMEVEISKVKNATKTCHACRKECDFDATNELVHTCEHCGATWDQDDNACLNRLANASKMKK